ncbi:DNA repair protein [Orchesella cincta]|uniref:DNA repair protein n=1 Tax=Orchesella cincta TaxID=48709 RepID=A0A1D2NBE2_ORCCI|nr:DNA repair protein [Orchesella cincta]
MYLKMGDSKKKDKLDLSKLSARELLLIGENPSYFGSQPSSSGSGKISKSQSRSDDEEMSSDSSDDSDEVASDSESEDWEEVDDKHVEAELKRYDTGDSTTPTEGASNSQVASIPEGGLEIVIPQEGVFRKRTKGPTVEEILRREMNREITEHQEYLHKTTLLVQVARGLQLNEGINSDAVKNALKVRITGRGSPSLTASRKSLDLAQLESLVKWFRANLLVFKPSMVKNLEITRKDLSIEEFLAYQIMENTSLDADYYVMIFVAFLRLLKLVISLQPVPLKPPSADLIRIPRAKQAKENDNEDEDSTSTKKKKSTSRKKVVEKKKSPKKVKKATPGKKLGRKMISSSEDEGDEPKGTLAVKLGQDMWVEVFLREEERWISVDVHSSKFICDKELEVNATKPISYILGFDNNCKVKDVTRRYASQWLIDTPKLRVKQTWWSSALRRYTGRKTERDKEEDEFLDQHLLSLPVPNSMSQVKGHCLYVLRRHLHKYEALYPDNPPSVGFVKNEPVYSRKYVYTLHTRIGEEPYKIVKARPKYDKFTGARLPDAPSELFGPWQTEDFIPPIAQDGKVPRNEWGNVELFTEKLLPQGCVHLRLPGLQRIAKKLDIDCAPAVVGFDFGCGGSRPAFDGFVVCEEFQELLEDAWNKDQDEKVKKDDEKRLQKIYGNWRKLVKGVLIRDRLEKKYSINLSGKRKVDDSSSAAGPSKRTKGK